jgi:hypothetical protein
MNLKIILLMFIIIAVALAGALLTGFQFSPATGTDTVQAAEQMKTFTENHEKSCCTEKTDLSKCPPDCNKPCCATKQNSGTCPPDCKKPCCTEKYTSPVGDEVPLCCG